MLFSLYKTRTCFLCRQLYEKFNSIYEVSQDVGYLVIPSLEMELKVSEWMANAATALEDVSCQVYTYRCHKALCALRVTRPCTQRDINIRPMAMQSVSRW